MSGKTLALRLGIPETINAPSRTVLTGSEIRWTVVDSALGDRGTLGPKPTWRCLNAFTRLANGSAEDVLNFTQKFGPLGIAPLVEIEDRGTLLVTRYREPVSLYLALSQRAKGIITIMKLVRAGQKVSSQDAERMFPVSARKVVETSEGDGLPPRGSALWGYGMLLMAYGVWHHAETTRIGVSWCLQEAGGPQGKRKGTFQRPQPQVNFGHWISGYEWDMDKDCLRGLAEMEARANAVQDDDPESDWPIFTPEQFAYLHQEGEPYAKYWEKKIQTIPDGSQRPSPLFNALAFHLMLEVTLEEGTFRCATCGDVNTRDLTKGNTPRTDRGEYCEHKPECKAEAVRANSRRSKAKAAKARMEATQRTMVSNTQTGPAGH